MYWTPPTRPSVGMATSSAADGPPGPPAGKLEPRLGDRKIDGELAGLGARVSASTEWEILTNAAIDPAPRRSGPAWSLSLRSQAEAIEACDFFTAGLLDGESRRIPRDRGPPSKPGTC